MTLNYPKKTVLSTDPDINYQVTSENYELFGFSGINVEMSSVKLSSISYLFIGKGRSWKHRYISIIFASDDKNIYLFIYLFLAFISQMRCIYTSLLKDLQNEICIVK